jgi:5-methylcytosine-specific restriction protein A
MSLDSPERLCQVLTNKLGVRFGFKVVTDSNFSLYFADLNEEETFFFDLQVEWKNFKITARPGSYSRRLLTAMQRTGAIDSDRFSRIFKIIGKQNLINRLSINGNVQDLSNRGIWNVSWSQFEWHIEPQLGTAVSLSNDARRDVIERTLLSCIGAILSLIPITAASDEEGRLITKTVEEYERNESLREDSLKFYGFVCLACDFDFASKYGAAGEKLIEVHHTERLADRGLSMTNPITDLVPLCANCHRIAHKRIPPYRVDEIKDMIKSADINKA